MELKTLKNITDDLYMLWTSEYSDGDPDWHLEIIEGTIVINSFPYGKYKGMNIKDIPCASLHWYLRQDWFFPKNNHLKWTIESHLKENNYVAKDASGDIKEDVDKLF